MACFYGRFYTKMKKLIIVLFFSFYSYAIIRYHFGKELSGFTETFFVLNKALAWTAGTLFLLTLFPQYQLDKFNLKRRQLGTTGYCFALVHILLILLILNPDLYPKFYSDSELNYDGFTTIFLGLSSLLLFSLPLYASLQKRETLQHLYRFGRFGIYLNILHVTSIGANGWFIPTNWPYFMPPITLIFVAQAALIILINKFVLKKNK